MINRENNPHRRRVEPKDLRNFAGEFLFGTIGTGVRAISTEVRGERVIWRCIFISQEAMQKDMPALEAVEQTLQGIFYWHAEVIGEYLVMENQEMRHLDQLLFLQPSSN